MGHLSLTTDSESYVEYARPENGDEALLIVGYQVPRLTAYRTRDGWQKTVTDCQAHELEAHEGLLREVREEVLEILLCGEEADDDDPFHLHVDILIHQLAEKREAFFNERTGEVTIDYGLFHDEWRVRQIAPETTDAAVLRVVLARMIENRKDLVANLFTRYRLQAVAHDRCN